MGDVHCVAVPGLEVKYKEHKHHAADCWVRWLLEVLLSPSLSHSDKDTASSLSAYGMRCVLVLAEKERPPAGSGVGGGGIRTSTPHRTISLLSPSLPHHVLPPNPPSLRKARLCPWLLAPTICLIGCMCVIVSLGEGPVSVRPPQISRRCASRALINCLT